MRKKAILSLRLRLRSGLRQSGSACGAAFYGRVGNPPLPGSWGGPWEPGRSCFARRPHLM